jgi:hypothetical protein
MAHPKLMLRGHFDVAVNWQNYLRVPTSVEELLVEAFFWRFAAGDGLIAVRRVFISLAEPKNG